MNTTNTARTIHAIDRRHILKVFASGFFLILFTQAFLPAPSAAQARPKLAPLHAWWAAGTEDNRTTSDPAWEGSPGGSKGGYGYHRLMGWIYAPDQAQPASTSPLYAWFSAARGDHLLTSDPAWSSTTPGEVRNGYTFLRLEGYILTSAPSTETLPLRSWWSSVRADNYATTLSEWSGPVGTLREAYIHYRVEGFVFPPHARSELKRFNRSLGLPSVSGGPEEFRSQGGSGRCQAFAAIAALEAAYKHTYGGDWDFSEQFLGYLGKVNWLTPTLRASAALAENQIGFLDGGGGLGLLHALEDGLRVAAENAAMPLVNAYGAWIKDEHGRWPLHDGTDTQDLFNTINWGPATINDGAPIVGMPQTMLERPLYYGVEETVTLCEGCTGVVSAADIERVIREGHEIVYDMSVIPHVALVVGYDRTDPARPVFLVRNSGGPSGAGEDGFELHPYSEVLRATALSYISRVRAPGAWPELRNLGRWKLHFDGHRGELVVNRLPGSSSRILAEYAGVTGGEARVGSFKDPTGEMFRVNGSMSGALVQFFIDSATPNLPFTQKTGRSFSYYRSGRDNTLLAGFHVDPDGTKVAGYATKGAYRTGRGSTATGARRWVGTWDVRVDGRTDVLTITASSATALNLSLRQGSITRAITGHFDPAQVQLVYYADDTVYVIKELNHAPGVAAGISGTAMGVVATRR